MEFGTKQSLGIENQHFVTQLICSSKAESLSLFQEAALPHFQPLLCHKCVPQIALPQQRLLSLKDDGYEVFHSGGLSCSFGDEHCHSRARRVPCLSTSLRSKPCRLVQSQHCSHCSLRGMDLRSMDGHSSHNTAALVKTFRKVM